MIIIVVRWVFCQAFRIFGLKTHTETQKQDQKKTYLFLVNYFLDRYLASRHVYLNLIIYITMSIIVNKIQQINSYFQLKYGLLFRKLLSTSAAVIEVFMIIIVVRWVFCQAFRIFGLKTHTETQKQDQKKTYLFLVNYFLDRYLASRHVYLNLIIYITMSIIVNKIQQINSYFQLKYGLLFRKLLDTTCE